MGPPSAPTSGMMRPQAPVDDEYEVRTLQEARDLATVLASAYPDPDRVTVGLTELIVNAVEHGNLGITYREKADLLEAGRFDAEIEHRMAQPDLVRRRVRVTLCRDAETVSVRIEDEGEGFDWHPFLDYDPDRALDPNGHGIAIARGMSFDDVTYHGRGNVVVATVRLDGGSVRPVDEDGPLSAVGEGA
jgi:anti-sigma regulatory factor (Ser/Thr protein kinase)